MQSFPFKNLFFGLCGGVAGLLVGGYLCQFLAQQGLYAAMIPGAFFGIGFSMAARKRHLAFGFTCGVLGLLSGLLVQWKVYSNEPSFFKLVYELKDDHFITWLLIGVGAVMGFSFGMGQDYNSHSSTPTNSD